METIEGVKGRVRTIYIERERAEVRLGLSKASSPTIHPHLKHRAIVYDVRPFYSS